MAKKSKVKWAIGAEEPEDLQDFLSNDDILTKNTDKKTKEVNWPGKGPYTFRVQFVRKGEIQNGDNAGQPRLRIMVVLQDEQTPDWNGYAVFDGFNVTDQGKSFLKRWLRSIGVEWKDFYNNTTQEENGDNIDIVRIGGVNFKGAKPVTLRATVKVKPADDYNDDEHLEIGRYLPAEGMVEDDSAKEEESVTNLDKESGSGSPATAEELDALDDKKLKKRAKKAGVDQDLPRKKMIKAILKVEPPF
jgi:hypothetical protein